MKTGSVYHGHDTFRVKQMFLLMPELGGNSKDAFLVFLKTLCYPIKLQLAEVFQLIISFFFFFFFD